VGRVKARVFATPGHSIVRKPPALPAAEGGSVRPCRLGTS
jgi:hypothetical protein